MKRRIRILLMLGLSPIRNSQYKLTTLSITEIPRSSTDIPKQKKITFKTQRVTIANPTATSSTLTPAGNEWRSRNCRTPGWYGPNRDGYYLWKNRRRNMRQHTSAKKIRVRQTASRIHRCETIDLVYRYADCIGQLLPAQKCS